MTLNVEDRLAALRNRLKERLEIADHRQITAEPAAPSLDAMIKRIQMNVRNIQSSPQMDDVNQ